ncbi:MAG: hypothetical protein AAFP19_08375 [Bacteroidota bacterium]
MFILRVFLLFVLFSVIMGACEPNPNDIIAANRRHIDTLVKREIKLLDKELDSLCILETKNQLQALVDSIMEVRLREIRAIRSRSNE